MQNMELTKPDLTLETRYFLGLPLSSPSVHAKLSSDSASKDQQTKTILPWSNQNILIRREKTVWVYSDASKSVESLQKARAHSTYDIFRVNRNECLFLLHGVSGLEIHRVHRLHLKGSCFASCSFEEDEHLRCAAIYNHLQIVLGSSKGKLRLASIRSKTATTEKIKNTCFDKVDAVASAYPLTACSMLGEKSVQIWNLESGVLVSTVKVDVVSALYASKYWIVVRTETDVYFYSAPNLSITRKLSLADEVNPLDNNSWFVRVAHNEAYALICTDKKVILYHILSGVLISTHQFSVQILDLVVLEDGRFAIDFSNELQILSWSEVLPKTLLGLHHAKNWVPSKTYQTALVNCMYGIWSPSEICMSNITEEKKISTMDEFICAFHLVMLAVEESEIIEEGHQIPAPSTFLLLQEILCTSTTVGVRSARHHSLVSSCLKQLNSRGILDASNIPTIPHFCYGESEDVLMLENSDIFELSMYHRDKAQFVLNLQQSYQRYVEKQTKLYSIPAALHIISFTQYFFYDNSSAGSGFNQVFSLQDFSNFLLGLNSTLKVSEASLIVDRIRLAAAAVIQAVERKPLQEWSSKIWKEALQSIDLTLGDLKKLYPSLHSPARTGKRY